MPPPAKRQRTTPACDMTVKELRAVLRVKGLPVSGLKAELVKRVEKARAEAEEDVPSSSSSSAAASASSSSSLCVSVGGSSGAPLSSSPPAAPSAGRAASSSPSLPLVGFGTYKLKDASARQACEQALRAGYRLIDTAQIYGNEREVGAALAASGVARDEVWVTTKVWRSAHGAERTVKSVRKSLRALGCGRIDLLLIHWPGPKRGWPLKRGTVCPPEWTPDLRVTGTWRAMEGLVREGLVRHIGVANFSVRQLRQLLAACKIRPCVNQVELHPLLQQRHLVEFCAAEGVAVQAFASLGSGDNAAGHAEMLALPAVAAAAKAHGTTPAQVLLRWATQQGVHVIPKSASRKRMVENFACGGFDLSAAEMLAIRRLDAGRRLTWKGVDPDSEL